ncbi:hypothetical protein IV38_GL001631 [Lactobacillus selangorensis]|uniref:Uncharacterized protein n=1 Tax=Lactobacillus selangorensis TaxID=81857 RepID=A0A0R2FHU4_9LACO|nr:hypothetical protein [Lactobacillus selangorensis]KRN28179.1 hypothetical protein IV38_GL001631 [Lactobacillus selangorensis]KRN30945.1 hypothetical protein IV40_GL001584 [Lactobacillus selangorensis]
MRFAVIGATYHEKSLSVFTEGLDDDRIESFKSALQSVISLLQGELTDTGIKELDELAAQVQKSTLVTSDDLNDLDNQTSDQLHVSWFDEHHFVIDVMDKSEKYQLHLEVEPIG